MNNNDDGASVVDQTIGRKLIGEMTAAEYQQAVAMLADAIRARKTPKRQ